MTAAKKSISLPGQIYEAALARAKRQGYASFSAYVQYLIERDLKEMPVHVTERIDPLAPKQPTRYDIAAEG